MCEDAVLHILKYSQITKKLNHRKDYKKYRNGQKKAKKDLEDANGLAAANSDDSRSNDDSSAPKDHAPPPNAAPAPATNAIPAQPASEDDHKKIEDCICAAKLAAFSVQEAMWQT